MLKGRVPFPWRRGLFLLSCTGVVVLSLLPAELIPSGFHWWDKAQHMLAFLILGLLGMWAWPNRKLQVVWGLCALGLGIELAQSATGWRYGDWQDGLADAIGVGISWGLAKRL